MLCVDLTSCFTFDIYVQLQLTFTLFLLLIFVIQYMFRPNWPSPCVQVALLKKSVVLLYYLNCLGLFFVLLKCTCLVYGFIGLSILSGSVCGSIECFCCSGSTLLCCRQSPFEGIRNSVEGNHYNPLSECQCSECKLEALQCSCMGKSHAQELAFTWTSLLHLNA